ncbi:MAG: RNA-binding protein [Psychromonas sp.]|nr:RNA-binding protein [Psychromonas sp.]
MKSNTSAIISIVIAMIGFLIFSTTHFTIAPDFAFSAGAILTGFVLTFASLKKSGEEYNSTKEILAAKTIYVGNLPYHVHETAIRLLFSEYGKVLSVRLMKDKQTGKRRGFGFVEMSKKDVKHAIEQLNEKEFQGRSLQVREANERVPRFEHAA